MVDATGLQILPINQERQVMGDDGQPHVVVVTIGFDVVAYGFGYNIVVGSYELEEQARALFNDILTHLKKGDEFYDVKTNEGKFLARVG